MPKPVTSIRSWLEHQEYNGQRVETLAPEVDTLGDTYAKIAKITKAKKRELKTKRPWWLLIIEDNGGLLITKETGEEGIKYTAYHFVHLSTSPDTSVRSVLIRTLVMLGAASNPKQAKNILAQHVGTKGMLVTRLNQDKPRFTPLNQGA
ncbi:MAG TPA: hypothetical protein VK502_03825 [Candidatus Saccharimonadales bacterium]|nr:hypothetical protein [Candidatus Saccharimonadales bacterium]